MATKREQRIAAAEARRDLAAGQRAAASAKICERLMELPELQRAKTVFSYMALGDEADLSAVHEWLRARGVRLAFPVSLPHGVMEAWEPGGWREGAYGICEPDRERSSPVAPEEIDLVLTPCVAFDGENRRLGHGGGYYDRFLPQCPQAVTVAAAFEAQRLEEVVCDAHDRSMDVVVTERGIFRK